MTTAASDPIADVFREYREIQAARTPKALFADGMPILVYGMGSVGKDVFDLLVSHGLPVQGILDRKALPGAAWRGVPVLRPDDEAIPLERRGGLHLVIGIFNAYVDIGALYASLKALGYTKITNFLELHQQFSVELGDRYWLTDRSYYRELEPIARAGYQLWADEASRALYLDTLRFRFSGDYSLLPPPALDTQYLPTDIPPWASPMRLVDCGAYDGDTVRQMLSGGVQLEGLAAFEPDQTNFIALAKYVAGLVDDIPDVVSLFPNGVHANTEQLRFAAGGGASSHLSASGETVIQCVSLDEAIPNFKPTLIKMDIEGAEYAAIWGAQKAIKKYQPGLAICLYHRPAHLWQIPLLLKTLCSDGYQLFLRSHCHSGFDLVMYGIPVV